MGIKLPSVVLCLSLAGLGLRPQQARDVAAASPVIATGSISGRVTADDAAGHPVRHASIHVQKLDTGLQADVPERIAITDDEGTFAFDRLPVGRYTVWATKAAWVTVWYGSKRPGDSIGAMSIVIADGQAIKGMSLKMAKGAAITGTITDLNGQPLPGFQATVLQSRMNFQTGVRTFVPLSAPQLGVADNRGVYRLYGLAPGRYIVMAEDVDGPSSFRLPSAAEWQWADAPAAGATPGPAAPDRSRARTYAPVYHPGTSVQASATMVTVSAGEERVGIDIRIDPVPVSSIDVSVQLAGGATMRDVLLAGIRTADDSSEQMFGRRPDDAGKVTVPNLMPGAYTIVARPPQGAAARFWALADVALTGVDASVVLTLQPGLEVGGRVMFAATMSQPPADLKRVRVGLVPASPGAFAAVLAPTATADANGAFSFSNVLPGKYRFTALIAGAGTNDVWSLASAMVRDRDALDVPIEIKPGEPIDALVTFTDRKTSLSGSLVDAAGRPASDYFVIAFPVDQTYWATGSRRIAAGRPGVDGRYHLNLPPGAYLVGAVTDVEPFQWFDPAFLTELRRQALAVTLTEGNATTQNLRLGGK